MHLQVVELWSVAEWNKHLFAAVFTGSDTPITYLDAHPVGLTQLLSWPTTTVMAERAAELLIDAQRPLVEGAAGSAVSAALQTCRDRAWRAQNDRPPPFFSLLWTTCMVAWGHPDVEVGDFAERWKGLFSLEGGGVQPTRAREDVSTGCQLLGRDVEKVEIRDLWTLTAEWLARRSEYRDLILPQTSGFERHVGTSYALSQPDLRDRRWLARAVTDLDIAGYDPPPGPVLRALMDRGRDPVGVSDAFVQHIGRLVDVDRNGGRLQQDPIWAAIRRECSDPVTTAGGVIPISRLTAVMDEYLHGFEGLLVWQGDEEPPTAPEGTSWRYDARTAEYILEGRDESGELWSFLEDPWILPRTGLARLAREGLVCLARDERVRLVVVTGAEVVNAEVALVREDMLIPLRDWVGGSSEQISTDGWVLLRGAELRAVTEDQLPLRLDGLRQLVRTSAPPTARWVGGVRVGLGAYFRHSELLPSVSAPGASTVIDETTRTQLLEIDGRWEFPPGTSPSSLDVRVVWHLNDDWPDTLLHARFEQASVHPPKAFASSDHDLLGPENGPTLDEKCGLHTRQGPLVRIERASATSRRAGAIVGSVDAPLSEAVLTHHGHPDHLLVSLLHEPEREVSSRSSDASARRRWRNDVKAAAVGGNIALRAGEVLDEHHPALVALRRAAIIKDLPVAELDQPNSSVLLHQLQRAYAEPQSNRTADELLAVSCIDFGRRSVSRKDYLETITQLTTSRDRITSSQLFALLHAGAETGRFELGRHRARPSVRLVGVRPRLRWALLAALPPPRRGVFEGALVGLVESATARRIAEDLKEFSDTRWLTATALPQESGPTDRLIAPVLKLLTDDPNRANDIARRHLGGRLGEPGVLPGVPEIASFEPQLGGLRPGGFAVKDSYLFGEAGPRHVPGRVEVGGVVIERLVAATRGDVYTVVADRELVYMSPDRSWATARAAELSQTPLFGRCHHGIVRSKSSLFPRLPMPIGRALLAHGLGLASSTFDESGRLASVTYPFGQGAPALDELPAWIYPEECECMTL